MCNIDLFELNFIDKDTYRIHCIDEKNYVRSYYCNKSDYINHMIQKAINEYNIHDYDITWETQSGNMLIYSRYKQIKITITKVIFIEKNA